MKRWLTVALAVAAATVGLAAPARAAVPDGNGFALWDGASVVPSGTWPPGTAVGMGVPGRYKVLFPGQAAKGGVVHVTAVSPAPHFCQVDKFGPTGTDELVYLSCYQPGGVLDPSGFTVHFASSSHPSAAAPGQYAYVDALANGAINTEFNSNAGPTVVAWLSTGRYLVRFSNLGSPVSPSGSWQATAVNPNVAARCKIARFFSLPNDQMAYVFCFDAAGLPFDTRFNATFQAERSLFGPAYPPKYFGYLWNAPLGGPPETNFNSVLGPGVNTVMSAGLGLWFVTFPQAAQQPDDVQVTAFGRGSDFCGLNFPWVDFGGDVLVRDVNCFTNAGVPVDAGFLISYTSAF